ncbi:MAG TPA: sigma-70 family RNA polymerase sigma factor [Bacteroidetes bacterium]|nr:sigma-70 family RNA polymerase sigma factor [Bacteroidota bacterium]
MKTDTNELVRACLAGGQKAQAELYDRYKTKMYGVCMRFASSQMEAEDMLMEGFYKIFKDLHQFKNQCPLEAWARQVVVNTALMYLRKKNRQIVPTVELEEISNGIAAGDDFSANIDAGIIVRLIQNLPDGYRTVFNLYAIEGYSHKEIADMQGTTESTSRSQYARAKSALQKLITKEGIFN